MCPLDQGMKIVLLTSARTTLEETEKQPAMVVSEKQPENKEMKIVNGNFFLLH